MKELCDVTVLSHRPSQLGPELLDLNLLGHLRIPPENHWPPGLGHNETTFASVGTRPLGNPPREQSFACVSPGLRTPTFRRPDGTDDSRRTGPFPVPGDGRCQERTVTRRIRCTSVSGPVDAANPNFTVSGTGWGAGKRRTRRKPSPS